MIYRANDKYRASLRSSWISAPADTTLQVTNLPTHVPTIVTVGWGASYETIFAVSGKSGDAPSNYALTGVTRLRGANENIPTDADVNCLNHEEFFNQYIPYVDMNFRGDYVAETTYSEGDVVYYNGSSYVAKEETTGNLPTDTDYWILIAQIGASIESAAFSGDDIVFTLTDASTVTLTDAAITLKGDTGEQGIQGETGNFINTFEGAWSAGSYSEGNIVTNNGASWIATVDTSGEPGVSADWSEIVEKGETGPTGPEGPEGPQGEPGEDGTIVAVSATAPSSPSVDDLWVDTS